MSLIPLIYSLFIDPLMKGSRKRIARLIPDNRKVADIAAGTGAFSCLIVDRASELTIVDLDNSMLKFARKSLKAYKNMNIKFELADIRNMSQFEDDRFDIAVLSLALHPFHEEERRVVLKEIMRVSKELILMDYTAPLPGNWNTFLVYFIERIAGRQHYRNFLSYLKNGGMKSVFNELFFKYTKKETSGGGVFTIYQLYKNGG